MSFSCPDLGIDQILHTAKLYGYDGIEPRIDAGHKHGIEIEAGRPALLEAKHKAADLAVNLCCLATSCSFANPANTRDNIDRAKRAIDLAAAVSSPVIRVFGGSIPEDVEREKSFDLIVCALSELSQYAGQRNVTVCLETHDSWCNPEAVAAIMKTVNHPSIAVNWDIMHPVLTSSFSVQKSFDLLQTWIRHVHVHDGKKMGGNLEFTPIGNGSIDHRLAVKNLKESGYAGFISGEWIDWEPYDIHLPREIAALKSFEQKDRSL
jgi:sugar phosphate isomerase/epimerase